MNSTQSIANALVAYTRGKLEAIQTGYAFPADQKTGALPDVAAEIQSIRVSREDTQDFPESGIEQAGIRVYSFHLMFLVEPEPPDAATAQLEGFVDQMTEAFLADSSMGNALPLVAVSPNTNSTFTPPFVEFDDGTRGRMATMELTVGELVDAVSTPFT